MEKFDVVIVGSGPSGYMCAYELANLNKDLKVLLIDKGHDIYKRKCPVLNHELERCPKNKEGIRGCYPACSMTSGFGGAGAYSDGKYNITTEFGGWLTDYIGDEEALELINYCDEINLKFGATKIITNPYTEEIKNIEKRAIGAGLKLLRAKVRHLGTEENLEILKRIYEYLKTKVEIRFKTCLKDIIVENNEVKGIIVDDNKEIYANKVVLCLGRDGAIFLNDLLTKHHVNMRNNQVDIGVRKLELFVQILVDM